MITLVYRQKYYAHRIVFKHPVTLIQSAQRMRTRTCNADRMRHFTATTEPFPASESAVAR
jgi:hypothetical protein